MIETVAGRGFLIVAGYSESIISFRGALISALQAADVSVHVAGPGLGLNSEIRHLLEQRGVRVHEIPLKRTGTSPATDLRLLLALWSLMREVRPFAVLGYTIKPVIYGVIAGWLAGVTHRYALITGLGYVFTGARKGLLTEVIKLLYRFALAQADKVFYQNPDDQEFFRESGVLPAGTPSVVVNGSGVDVAAFEEQVVPNGAPTYLMIGRLIGDKGVREYTEAARRVRSLYPDIRFGLVGWIDENPDAIAQDELDAWIASDTIEFHGKLDDVRPSIAACSVYVLPSYREGTPRTVLEAMAIGRPIITTDAPGCRETVIDGDNGFLVPVQSVDALVDAMLKFIKDPTLAQRMGRRSRQIAEDKYDVHKVNAVMLREMGITAAPEARAGVA